MPKPSCQQPVFQDCWSPGAANSVYSRTARRQVHMPRCLSPAANSLYSRIAGCQVPKPRCLSPAANSLHSRIAGCQVPKPRCLSPKNTKNIFPALRAEGCLDLQTKPTKNAFSTLRLAFHSWQTLGRPRSALQKHSVTAVPRRTPVTMNPSQPPFEFAEL